MQAWRYLRSQEHCKVRVSVMALVLVLIHLYNSQFHLDDNNVLAVLTYAVQNLGVEHGRFLSQLSL